MVEFCGLFRTFWFSFAWDIGQHIRIDIDHTFQILWMVVKFEKIIKRNTLFGVFLFVFVDKLPVFAIGALIDGILYLATDLVICKSGRIIFGRSSMMIIVGLNAASLFARSLMSLWFFAFFSSKAVELASEVSPIWKVAILSTGTAFSNLSL